MERIGQLGDQQCLFRSRGGERQQRIQLAAHGRLCREQRIHAGKLCAKQDRSLSQFGLLRLQLRFGCIELLLRFFGGGFQLLLSLVEHLLTGGQPFLTVLQLGAPVGNLFFRF